MVGAALHVRGTVVRVKGKGLYIKPKGKSGYRTLELPAWAVAMLRRRKRCATPNDWDVVFTASLGGLRDPGNTQRDPRAALDRAGYGWATSQSCRRPSPRSWTRPDCLPVLPPTSSATRRYR